MQVISMQFSQLAEEYILFNVYNDETARAIRLACNLFDRRSQCKDVSELSGQHVANFRSETLKLANEFTFNGYLSYLKGINKWALKEQKMSSDLILKLRKAPTPKPKPKTIPSDTYKDLLMVLRSNDDIVPVTWFWLIVIRVLYGCGVRRRQLVEINVGDINWKEKTLALRYQGSKTRREWDIPLITSVLKDLETLVQSVEQALGRSMQPEDRLFNICYFNPRCSPDPKDPTKMRARYITEVMQKISEKTGMRIGAHRLRHTMATDLCNPIDPDDAPDIFFAQHVLGHSKIDTTRGYVQTRIQDRRGYMERMLINSTVN